jgi:hypothetical protein
MQSFYQNRLCTDNKKLGKFLANFRKFGRIWGAKSISKGLPNPIYEENSRMIYTVCMMKSNTILSKISLFLTVVYEKEEEGHLGKRIENTDAF